MPSVVVPSMFSRMSDSREAEQAVAAFFHHTRAAKKKGSKGKAKGDPPMHHRANTDWWNSIDKV